MSETKPTKKKRMEATEEKKKVEMMKRMTAPGEAMSQQKKRWGMRCRSFRDIWTERQTRRRRNLGVPRGKWEGVAAATPTKVLARTRTTTKTKTKVEFGGDASPRRLRRLKLWNRKAQVVSYPPWKMQDGRTRVVVVVVVVVVAVVVVVVVVVVFVVVVVVVVVVVAVVVVVLMKSMTYRRWRIKK